MRIKKLLSTMLAIAMMASLGAVPAFAEIDWNSTSISINTVDELKAFAEEVNSGNGFEGQTVILEQSLDLTNDPWTPIGNGQRSGKSYSGYAFRGIFDGGNHTISGLRIAGAETVDHAMGLFGVVDGGTVKNLTLDTVSISSNSECIGAAVGLAVGGATVQAIKVSGTISAADGVGGVVGRMTVEGTIENCTNNAAVTATGNGAGGIVGKAYYTEAGKSMNILQCTNTGAITSYYGAGGIASLSAANVIGCTNSGKIFVDRENATTEAGGIVGEQSTFGEVSGNTNSGRVTASIVGGIIGWIRYDSNTVNYGNTKTISVRGNTNCAEIDSHTGGLNAAGGIVGLVYNKADISANENTAEKISGVGFAAGIAGGLQDPVQEATIEVANNVSTTLLDNITGDYKDLYAYNNAPDTFIVKNNVTECVAVIGETKYASLEAAVAAAQDNETVVLRMDVTLNTDLDIPAKGSLILDLDGHTITGGEYQVRATSGTVTITGGGTITNSNTIPEDGYSAIMVFSEGSVILNDVKVNGQYGIYVFGSLDVQKAEITAVACGIAVQNQGQVKIGSPEMKQEDIVVNSQANCISTQAQGGQEAMKVEIYGGTFRSTTNTAWNAGPIYWASHGTLEIYGGSFVGQVGDMAGVLVKNGTVKIMDGSFDAKDGIKVVAQGDSTEITVDLSGGNFNGTRSGIYVDASNSAYMGGLTTYSVKIHNGASTVPGFTGQEKGAVYKKTAGLAEGQKIMDISGGMFSNSVPVDCCAEGFKPVANSDGSFGVVSDDTRANEVKVVFEKVSEDDNALYNIILESTDASIINRLTSADLTFEKTGKNIGYVIEKVGSINFTNESGNRYLFHLDGVTKPDETGTKITIGQVQFTGYGDVVFKVSGEATTNIVNATKVSDNIVDSFIVNGVLAGKGNLDLNNEEGESGRINTTLEAVKEKLTVNVKFNNAIEANAAAYQDMKAVISGGDLTKDITVEFGNIDQAASETQNAIVNLVDNTYRFEQELTQHISYTITISGKGYRTARYTVNMAEEKTLNFWNNVMDEANAAPIELGKSSGAVTKNFLAGDIVMDNQINLYDLSAVVSYFGVSGLSVDNQPEYAKYDLNRDGKIDSKDVAYVLVSWGE